MDEPEWHPPSWIFRETKPPNDNAYFENLTRVIFQAGLSWQLVDKKWPNFQEVFESFVIDKVGKFDEEKIEELLENQNIIRNRKKIEATIFNAQEIQKIRKEFGSFESYIDSLDKSNNYELAIKTLSDRFKHVGPSTARIFLYSIGEKVSHPD